MAVSEQGFIDQLVGEEIRRMIAGAIAEGVVLSTRSCAAKIMQAHRDCGLTESEIADRVMMAAASAGVPVEFGATAPI